LYYLPQPPSAEEVAIKRLIDEIYTRHPFFGSRRMKVVLVSKGHRVNRKRVQRYMEEMGIAGICPGPNLSKARQEAHRFPYLLRDVEILRPNHVWGIYITYIRLRRGWMYLVAVLDWFSRFVVSWELDQTLEMPFVIEAVGRALSRTTPEIFNSDQGSHFTSSQYIGLVQGKGAQVSMDGRGRAMDNIFTERLWRSVKYEEVYLKEYDSPREARQGIGSYLEFYNHRRPHQSLAYKTPAACYQGIKG
jgi:putative transposase